MASNAHLQQQLLKRHAELETNALQRDGEARTLFMSYPKPNVLTHTP